MSQRSRSCSSRMRLSRDASIRVLTVVVRSSTMAIPWVVTPSASKDSMMLKRRYHLQPRQRDGYQGPLSAVLWQRVLLHRRLPPRGFPQNWNGRSHSIVGVAVDIAIHHDVPINTIFDDSLDLRCFLSSDSISCSIASSSVIPMCSPLFTFLQIVHDLFMLGL